MGQYLNDCRGKQTGFSADVGQSPSLSGKNALPPIVRAGLARESRVSGCPVIRDAATLG